MASPTRRGKPWQPMKRAVLTPMRPAARALLGDKDVPQEIWMNDRYTVIVYEHPNGVRQLSIRRNDREWPRDWRHFQRIKNEICGPELEAVELYPRESRLVDGANQFHLWVLPAGVDVPLGYFPPERSVSDGDEPELQHVGGRQRPLDEVS